MNAPQYWRNMQLSGSPLGFDSPFANGTFLLRNSEPGFKATISNVVRNVSDELGARSQRWNQAVYDNVVRLHGLLNINPNDPDTTWQWSRYGPPENTRHEANANNKWHLLLLCTALLVVARGAWKHGDFAWLLYGCGVLAGFFAFCVVLRWQPYGARFWRRYSCSAHRWQVLSLRVSGHRSWLSEFASFCWITPVSHCSRTGYDRSEVLDLYFKLRVNPDILQIFIQWRMKVLM